MKSDNDNHDSSSSSFDDDDDEDDEDDAGQLTSSTKLLEIIENIFPTENIVYVFGYGSGVFSQDDDKNKMIDIIIVVDDAYEFHTKNMQKNPNHYSSILQHLLLSPTRIVNLQRNFILKDGKVLFHVVDDDSVATKMKYGIIHIDDLCQDLIQWESLYIAGRLHKPTLPLVLSSNSSSNSTISTRRRIDEAQHINLQAAVSSALLLSSSQHDDDGISSPTTTTTTSQHDINNVPFTKFYSQIAGISYGGDFRMKVGGEDPQKISKLVTGNTQQIQRFHNMYMSQILQPLEEIGILSINNNKIGNGNGNGNGSISWNPYDISARNHLIGQLPKKIQSQINIPTTSGATSSSSNNTSVDKVLPNILANIVSRPARNQSMKGILTLGFRKSIQYATAKLSKGGGLFRF